MSLKPVNILWISDIHYKQEFEGNEHVVTYLESFEAYVKSLEHEIDFLIVSGDIAYSGKAVEYLKFKERISKIFPNIPVLSIPGNHDVQWDGVKSALAGNSDIDIVNLHKQDPSTILGLFKKIFEHYNSIWQSEFDKLLNADKDRFKFYRDPESYNGYLFFKEKNILFILINSSFYSLAPGSLATAVTEYYQKQIKKRGGEDNTAVLSELIGDVLSQQGKQSYMFDKFPSREIKKIINEAMPTVVSIAHHPPDWLRWEERFSGDKEVNQAWLFERTHILLTGHVHGPPSPPDILQGKAYHISGGCFMYYGNIEKENAKLKERFLNNWFGELEVFPSEFNFSARMYDPVDSEELAKSKESWKEISIVPGNHVAFKFKLLESRFPGIASELGISITHRDKIDCKEFCEVMEHHRSMKFLHNPGIRLTPKFWSKIKLAEPEQEDQQYLICLCSPKDLQGQIVKCINARSDPFEKIPILKRLKVELPENPGISSIAFYLIFELPAKVKKILEVNDELKGKRNQLFQKRYQEEKDAFLSLKYYFFENFPLKEEYHDIALTFDCILS